MTNLRSDNEAPVHPAIMQALIEANAGAAHAYGGDPWTGRLTEVLGEVFETELEVFPLISGTAANSLCVAQVSKPTSAVLCHQEAHLYDSECGAPEFYSGGAKLIPLSGEHARIDPAALQAALDKLGHFGDHDPDPSVLTLTQGTEWGAVYSLEQTAELCAIAHARGMATHMDGARFANAVVSLGVSPADLTWRAGIDLMSFSLTKNGAMAAEAVVFFRKGLSDGFGRRRMKGGHLLSKMRYVSAQLLAGVKDGLWLELAAHANRGASAIGRAFAARSDVTLLHPVEINEVFVLMSPELDAHLRAGGFEYHPFPGRPGLYRMVVPYDASEAAIGELCSRIGSFGG